MEAIVKCPQNMLIFMAYFCVYFVHLFMYVRLFVSLYTLPEMVNKVEYIANGYGAILR